MGLVDTGDFRYDSTYWLLPAAATCWDESVKVHRSDGSTGEAGAVDCDELCGFEHVRNGVALLLVQQHGLDFACCELTCWMLFGTCCQV